MSKGYQPVPVEAALRIGIAHSKQIVVIVSWDETCRRIHTKTWGQSAKHKEWAAELGPILARAAGGETKLSEHYEDFREPGTAAKNAEQVAVFRTQLLNIAETARRWAVASGGDTPLALIASLAREALGLNADQVAAEVKAMVPDVAKSDGE